MVKEFNVIQENKLIVADLTKNLVVAVIMLINILFKEVFKYGNGL